jgi:hypothetical protein
VSAARIAPATGRACARPAVPAPPDVPRRPLRVGLLHNPLSGRRRGGDAIRRALAGTRGPGAQRVTTPAEVAAALARCAEDGVDLVVVSGGDGTVQAVLTALFHGRVFEVPPLLAVMPSGTANMIAGDVGLRGNRAAALRRVLAWAGDPERRPAVVGRAVIRVQAAPGAEPAFGMFLGAGAIHDGTHYCLNRLHPLGIRGQLAPAVALARYALAAAAGRPMPGVAVASAVDGAPAETGERLLFFVTTLERLVLGLRPFWGTGEGALRFTSVATRPRQLLRALPSLLRGRPGRFGTVERGYTSRNANEIRLEFDGGFALDGQLLRAESRRGPVVLGDGGRARFVQC